MGKGKCARRFSFLGVPSWLDFIPRCGMVRAFSSRVISSLLHFDGEREATEVGGSLPYAPVRGVHVGIERSLHRHREHDLLAGWHALREGDDVVVGSQLRAAQVYELETA